MKILFWILAILSIPVGLFMSYMCYLAYGLDLYYSGIGAALCILGMLSVAVSIACVVFGVIKLRKGKVKKAVALTFAGLAYSGIIIAGIFAEEAVNTVLMSKDIAERKDEMYGENWDSAPAVDGIPEQYVEVLNELYAMAKDQLDSELMGFGVVSMPEYYGDAPLDHIGFTLMDVNGDAVDELVIGTSAPVEGGTVIFAIYSDPENPFYSVSSVEGEIYYLHAGEPEGTYLAEIGGTDRAWLLGVMDGETMVDIIPREDALDPAGRLTLDMIPFSQYK